MKRRFAILSLMLVAIAMSFHVPAGAAQASDAEITESALNVMTEIYSIDSDIAETFRYEIASAEDPVTVNVYPFDDRDDPFVIVYDSDGFVLRIDPPDILNFDILDGQEYYFDFLGMDDEQRAQYSKEYIPKVEALLRIDPDFYEDAFPSSIAEKARWHYDTTRRVYGVPDEGDLTKQEGYEKALTVLEEQFDVKWSPEGDDEVNYYDSFFDVTDPEQHFWQYDINLLNKEDPSKGGYYIVSIDSKTGEVVDAFEYTDDMPLYLLY